MANIGFYLGMFFGFIAGMLIFFITSSSPYPEYHNATSMGVGVLIMLVFGSISGVAIFMDLRPMFREWNIERKTEELHMREKEEELKRKEQKFNEKTWTKPEESGEKTNHFDGFDTQSKPHQKQPASEPKKTSTESPFHDRKTSEATFTDEPILKTGSPVADDFKEPSFESTLEESSEKSSNDEYVRHVKIDPILRSLWFLYNSKEGFFMGQTEAARVIFDIPENEKVSGSRREDVKASMNELGHSGLITVIRIKGDIRKKKQLFEYKITPKGKELMKRAIEENIWRWVDFVEKYKFEIKK